MVMMYICTHKTVWLREGFDNQIRNCRLLSKKLRKEKRCGFVNTLKFEKQAMSIICPGLPYQEAVELVNIVPIVYFITGLCSYTFDTIIKVPRHRLHSWSHLVDRHVMFRDATSTSSYLNARLIALEIILFLDPVLIIYIYVDFQSFFNILCVLYTFLYTSIFTVLSFVNTQFSLRVAKYWWLNYLSIYLSIYLSVCKRVSHF